MEDQAMSLIGKGYAVSTCGGFLGILLSALLALALFDPGAATAQEVKQIKLTEKHIQSFMAAYDDIAKLYYGANQDKPDPMVEAQAARRIRQRPRPNHETLEQPTRKRMITR